jgi:hypothetical protein
MKYLLTNAPVLNIADLNKEFLVCTDACKEGLEGVLMQGHVIFYESRHDMELATIVHALKMWGHYLLVRIFVLMTYHSGLRYLFDQPKLNVRQARWMDLLSEFDFEIKHIKGKENRVVDALSRSMKLVHLEVVSASESDFKERVKTAHETYSFFKTIYWSS